MTVQSPDTPERSSLAELLVASDRDPVRLVREIRHAREATAAPDLARDLDEIELRFLAEQAACAGSDATLRAAVVDAQRAWLGFEQRYLSDAAPTPGVLFDLAELRAALEEQGSTARAAEVGAEIDRRIATVEVGDALVEEAEERFVGLVADTEDRTLRHQVLLLASTSRMLLALAERSGNRKLRRLGKRLWRVSCDRTLALRLERVLTRRGAAILETTSFVLLFVLLGLLFVESVFSFSRATLATFLWLDAGICTFFVVEFFFKLALSPVRLSWFLRNAVTDLLPALPAAIVFTNIPSVPGQDEIVLVRVLRLLRIVYFARYIRALRPALQLFRLVLFMVRGLDQLVQRFSKLLNRNFVFFEHVDPATVEARVQESTDPRVRTFQALRREHVLLEDLPWPKRNELLTERSRSLAARLGNAAPVRRDVRVDVAPTRDVPVEIAIEKLHTLQPDDLALFLPRVDLIALDRIGRVINAPFVRSLPFIRKLRSPRPGHTPEERVCDLAKRVANRLEWWHECILYFADFHGILTGPQILDRVATAMVTASKRPAMRLLLFGGLFLIVRLLVGDDSAIGVFLKRFVATPLLVLGGVCLVVLWLGRWFKRLAGEAAETLQRTSEAHFIGLLELQKRRQEDVDTAFLSRRVFRWELEPGQAQRALCTSVASIRSGEVEAGEQPPAAIREDLNRVSLLYLHFLDGAILHETDVKTNEQLLANLSLENIRLDHLGFSKRDRKRLRKLALDEGSLLSGPYLWFRFITESVALETAKRVVEYNRHCLPLAARARAPAEAREAMESWMRNRRAQMSGRSLDKVEATGRNGYVTTEFNALDFLSPDPNRREHIRAIFGDEVVELLSDDRRHMVREIFGMRPLDQLPRSRRVLNFYLLYTRRLSRGRFLLTPFYWLVMVVRIGGFSIAKTVEIVREIIAPAAAKRHWVSGRAPFSVALRKIHRMKAPGLLEAMAMRAAFDPAYCGAPPGWSTTHEVEEVSELERDMDFLGMKKREREQLLDRGGEVRRHVETCHFRMRELPPLPRVEDELELCLAERAVTIAWVTDRDSLRTLLGAEAWFERTLPDFESPAVRVPRHRLAAVFGWIGRGFRSHPVTVWLRQRVPGRRVSRRARNNFKAAYCDRGGDARRIVDAWNALPPDVTPTERGLAVLRGVFRDHDTVSRELAALRAVQSLSVLDVRNYRQLVFRLGGYAEDGEDPSVASALP